MTDNKAAVEGDILIGTQAYLEIMHPAEEFEAQTEGENMLKDVIHKLKDVHRVLSAELIESRDEVVRLKALVEEKRAEIEAIETEEKKARRAELERVRTEYCAQVKKQKVQADDLIRRLKIMDKTVQGKNRDIKYRDSLLEERAREAHEKDQKITELIRSVRQLEIVIGTTREERDKKHRDASERIRVVSDLEDKIAQKEITLRQRDEEVSTLRDRADEVTRKYNDTVKTKNDLEVAIEKTRTESEFTEQKLKMQISSVTSELEEIKLQSEQLNSSSEYTTKTIQDLIDDNKDKDEAIFRATQVVMDQQIREQEMQDMNRFKTFEFQNKLKDLRAVDDGLMYAVTISGRKGGVEPWRIASPQHTLVQCYPMALPVVVGQPVTIIITTRNQTGVLVKAAYPSEFAVSVSGKYLGSPEVAKELTAPSEPLSPKSRRAKPDKESSTFTLTHFATSAGWKPVTVKFRGDILTSGFYVYATAEEASRATIIRDKGDLSDLEVSILQNRMKLLNNPHEYSEKAITVSCQPPHARPGEEVDVYVVVRDPTTHRPVLQSDDLAADINLSPFFGGSNLKATWMNCLDFLTRVGSSAVYQTKMRLPFDDSLDYTGVIATLGDWTASAICWMKPPAKGRVDPVKTLITCYPDPVTPGELVTATISTRGTEYEPVSHIDAQAILFTVTGINGVSKISPIEKVGSNWRCTFRAERKGRSGIQVDYSGESYGQATVEVRASNQYVPKNTVIEFNPPKNARPGQRVYVTIKTNDSTNHLSQGPPADAFDLTPVGSVVKVGGHKLHSLSRGAYDGVYSTHFTVESNAAIGSKAGVEVALEGAVVSSTVDVTEREGTYLEDDWRQITPPLEAAFTQDPVRAEEAAFLVVCSLEEPRVVGGYNVMYVGQPVKQKWCEKAWVIRVQIGQRSGFSSVTVEADARTLNVSVSVDTMPVKDLEAEIERLKQIETKFSESWDGKWASTQRSRAGSRTGSLKGSRSGSIPGNASPLRGYSSNSLIRPESPTKKKVTYPKIGIELANYVPEFGEEEIIGTKVVEVKYGEAADMSGIREHDIITAISIKGTSTVRQIATQDDFRDFLKELGNKAPYPTLSVVLKRVDENGAAEMVLDLIPGVSETVVNVKKKKKRSLSRGMSRSRSRSIGRSRSASKTSSKKKSSTKKKKSSKKKSSKKKKSTKKKSSTKKKKSTKKKSTKKKSTKKKKPGVMTTAGFLA
eukprot:TRINITY_DN9060_c0_g2_i1.p1 TRINITY_DN9060_c0_g2~~TRINITY_DN9060_c0_g2_i1.p1  ORF type:complete len:1232 (+),score=426.22 TRINITY_DN9060_c0_g2_i1:56-3697(+)